MIKKILFAVVLVFAFAGTTSAQCKSLSKKKCGPQLKPYTSSGKMNAAVMRPGDRAEVMVTFNADIDYRLMICFNETINVNFKVMDTDRNTFFDSKKAKKAYFDFNVASTQQLIIEVECEDKESLTGIVPEGCVSILTGYKTKK